MYNTQTNNIYEYFDAIEGYSPIAVIYGHPSDNLHCPGLIKQIGWMPQRDNMLRGFRIKSVTVQNI